MTDEKLWITFSQETNQHLLMQDRDVIGIYDERFEATMELDRILDTGRASGSRYQNRSMTREC